jgi:preprotein translocase subunit YajC
MKLFQNHKKRVEKVKDYAGKNKVFVATMIVAIIFLFINFVIQPNNPQRENHETTISDNSAIAETTAETQREWRFYFIDVIVLVTVGGFCTIMILRERKKTREELK